MHYFPNILYSFGSLEIHGLTRLLKESLKN